MLLLLHIKNLNSLQSKTKVKTWQPIKSYLFSTALQNKDHPWFFCSDFYASGQFRYYRQQKKFGVRENWANYVFSSSYFCTLDIALFLSIPYQCDNCLYIFIWCYKLFRESLSHKHSFLGQPLTFDNAYKRFFFYRVYARSNSSENRVALIYTSEDTKSRTNFGKGISLQFSSKSVQQKSTKISRIS